MNSLDRTLTCLDLSRDDCAVLLWLDEASGNDAPESLPAECVHKLLGRHLIKSGCHMLMITPAGEAILEALEVLAWNQTRGQLLHFPVRQTVSSAKMPGNACRVIPFPRGAALTR
jgi:hypothetical protein